MFERKLKIRNMRKLLIATLMIVGANSLSFAQDKGKVEFGVQVGYNSSNASTSNNSADNISGVNFGVSGDYYFSNRWSLKIKAIYDQKGYEIPDIRFDSKVRLTYLTVPVMANWHFGSKRNWYLNFGPYVGFLTKAEATESGTDVKPFFNSTDFGLALGIGVKIPVSDRLKLFLEFDGQGGFSDIFKNEENERDNDDNVTNSRSSFNVGLNFLLQ